MPDRKRVKPRREAKKVTIKNVIEVGPRGLYWSIKVNGQHLGSVFSKKDAEAIAEFIKGLALCEGGVSLRIKDGLGRHQREETFPRAADPRRSRG